jgi:beta-lactamase regulating signal transducer with metallopeptidase domain
MIADFVAPADSARVAAAMYGVSLLSLAPVALAALGALTLRRATAGTRLFVWRAAVLALLLCLAGRISPAHWTAWVLPSFVAAPLVALGRVQMTEPVAALLVGQATGGGGWPGIAVTVYCVCAAAVLTPFVVALARLRRLRTRALRVDHLAAPWGEPIADARRRVGLSSELRVYLSSEIAVPATWGLLRPVIMLPIAARAWSSSQIELALAHEMAHVRSRDWVFGLIGRAVCVLFWFNPAVWWLERRLAADRELACDERVLATGAARSDYAELLVLGATALEAAQPGRRARGAAFGLVSGGGLRQRLRKILEPEHARSRQHGGRVVSAVLAAAMLAAPISMVRLAPTRGVLDSLMQDVRWQTRAYAVVGLAQRRDSLAVARSAAERDPNPRVRAWARYALAVSPTPR